MSPFFVFLRDQMSLKMRFFRFICFFIAHVCHSQCGLVVDVKDGDTFNLLLSNNLTLKVRVAFVDAPEHDQRFGDKSKLFTLQLINEKRVCLDVKYKDPYGRFVAIVKLANGKVLNEELIKNGFAWHYAQYSNNPVLRSLQENAKRKHIGLWSDSSPVPPWQWRREHHIGRMNHTAKPKSRH